MDMERLIARLEAAHVVLAERPGDKASDESIEVDDQVRMLQSVCLRNTDTVQQCMKRRNMLENEGKRRSADGIAAQAAVRRGLNELALSAEQLRQGYDKRKREKGRTIWEDRVVSDLLRSVDDCIASEIKRSGAKTVTRADSPGWSGSTEFDLRLGAQGAGSKLNGGVRFSAPKDPEIQSLLDVKHRNQEIEGGLFEIHEGLGRLRDIATDMHQEVLVQSIMIDEIQARADHTDKELKNINKRLAHTLRDAGGASRILVNMFLFVVLSSLAFFVYCTIKNAHPSLQ